MKRSTGGISIRPCPGDGRIATIVLLVLVCLAAATAARAATGDEEPAAKAAAPASPGDSETVVEVTAPASRKTDVVVMRNGDRLTGEIKSLERGRLVFSTDDMGTIRIEWEKIVRVESRYLYDIETEGFRRFYGSFAPSAEDGSVAIATGDTSFTLPIERVVRITPLRGSFWRRLKTTLEAGYSFTSANSQQQITLGSEFSYRTERYNRRLVMNTFYSDREGESSTSRSLASFDYTRYLPHRPRDFLTGLATWEQNDELGLDHRETVGAGVGRHMIQSNKVQLGLLGGLIVYREQFTGSTEKETFVDPDMDNTADDYNLDLLLAKNLSVVRWDDPELDFSSDLYVFPSLTSWGRWRARLDARLRYEVFSDFYVGLSGFADYDSEPPVEGVEKVDFSVSLTVSWSVNT